MKTAIRNWRANSPVIILQGRQERVYLGFGLATPSRFSWASSVW